MLKEIALKTLKKPLVMFMLGVMSVLIIASILPQNITASNLDMPLQTTETRDKPSPTNYFEENNIHVYKDKIVIDAENIKWAAFTDTKSMLPFISKDSNALQVEPVCPQEINEGDVVSYKSEFADGIIIHRVVFKGSDSDGTYFILKGDNNPSNDPGKIRCSQIQRRVIGVLY